MFNQKLLMIYKWSLDATLLYIPAGFMKNEYIQIYPEKKNSTYTDVIVVLLISGMLLNRDQGWIDDPQIFCFHCIYVLRKMFLITGK